MKIQILHHNPQVQEYFQNYQLSEDATEVTAIVCGSKTVLDAATLSQYPLLKNIIACCSGIDKIDRSYCKEHSIEIFNSPTANINAVADITVAVILTSLRKLIPANAAMHQGRWDRSACVGKELSELTVGFVGFGRIAGLVHDRLKAFGTKNVIAFDPFLSQEHIETRAAQKVETLEELFSAADIVSLHLPLLDSTRHLIDASKLSLLKDGSLLVNFARGGIINEADLLEQLKAKRLYAALDVFETEPEFNKAFCGLDNVILTPHIGAMTSKAQEEMILEAKRRFEDSLN